MEFVIVGAAVELIVVAEAQELVVAVPAIEEVGLVVVVRREAVVAANSVLVLLAAVVVVVIVVTDVGCHVGVLLPIVLVCSGLEAGYSIRALKIDATAQGSRTRECRETGGEDWPKGDASDDCIAYR